MFFVRLCVFRMSINNVGAKILFLNIFIKALIIHKLLLITHKNKVDDLCKQMINDLI